MLCEGFGCAGLAIVYTEKLIAVLFRAVIVGAGGLL
jgi:hypothetical protein